MGPRRFEYSTDTARPLRSCLIVRQAGTRSVVTATCQIRGAVVKCATARGTQYVKRWLRSWRPAGHHEGRASCEGGPPQDALDDCLPRSDGHGGNTAALRFLGEPCSVGGTLA